VRKDEIQDRLRWLLAKAAQLPAVWALAVLASPKPTPAVDRFSAADDPCKGEPCPAANAAGNGSRIASGWLTFGVGAGPVFDVG
jgi:hypothetical protein